MAGTVLVDADILVHKYCHAATREYSWGDGKTHTISDERRAHRRVDRAVKDIMKDTDCGRAVLVLSDPERSHNWRVGVLSTYKHNRAASNRPKGFWRLRDYMERKYLTKQQHSLEADDLLGLLLTCKKPIAGRKVCASIDKDLLTVPGLHFQWDPTKAAGDRTGVFKVGEKEALRRFYLQILHGDPTDGYHGLPGIGPKKAALILDNARSDSEIEWWRAVVDAYTAEYGSEGQSRALQQARCARILRRGDYTRKDGVRLWEPPTSK
jgi:DNA polymerase-1